MSVDDRIPQAFILKDTVDEDAITRKATTSKGRTTTIKIDAEDPVPAAITVPVTEARITLRRWRLLTLLATGMFALFTMWLGLTITRLVEAFFARSPALGWLAFGLAALVALAVIGIIVREIWGLFSLRRIEQLQDHAARAINLKDRQSASTALSELENLYNGDASAADALAQLARHRSHIMNPEDRLQLADRLLLEPRDAQARAIVARRARRVTILTTVTPAAVFDILFVAAQNLMMLREVASIYGGRPSTLSTLRLARMVATHLAVTGGLALSDNLLQHVVGKGLLGRLSARLGEGAVNGILTARIGLAACNVCRPIPNSDNGRDRLTAMARELVAFKNETVPEP
jgi:putative membrane protein